MTFEGEAFVSNVRLGVAVLAVGEMMPSVCYRERERDTRE